MSVELTQDIKNTIWIFVLLLYFFHYNLSKIEKSFIIHKEKPKDYSSVFENISISSRKVGFLAVTF